MKSFRALLFISIFVFCVSPLWGQSGVDLSDVGEVVLENNGAAEAQQPFLHGLAQLHNFEYGFAGEDFREAQSIDPNFALAYWGEAMTYNHPIWMQQDRDAALEVLNKFASTPEKRQEKAPSALARDLFAAVDILYGKGEKHDRDDRYRDFMAQLHEKYPDNVEVAAQYALSIMGTAHEGREFGLYMQSAALMQKFFVDYPTHPGVAHYLIHATDDPIHAPLGLDAANAYAEIAPNAAHAQHMTTHIFLALGDWDGVIRANVRASEIANAHRAKQGKGPVGCGHYPSWLMYGYLQVGERDKAHEIMKRCTENMQDPDFQNPGAQSYYTTQRALYLIDTKEWDGDIAVTRADMGDNVRAHLSLDITDAWIALGQNNTEEAHTKYASAKANLKKVHAFWDEQGATAEHEPRVKADIALMQLEAQLKNTAGDADGAIAMMRHAVEKEMTLSYGFGPPSPEKPGLELLGEMLLENGDYEEARNVLKQSLSRTPNKTLSRLALEKAEAMMASESE